MKAVLWIILLLHFHLPSPGQKSEESRDIDSIVEKMDALRKGNEKIHTKSRQINRKKIIEKCVYFTNKEFTFIQVDYKVDSTLYTEQYYLKLQSLIFATEKEVLYFPSSENNDPISWSGIFYFAYGRLRDHETLGHGKSELDTWDPEKEILQRLKKRKTQIPSTQ